MDRKDGRFDNRSPRDRDAVNQLPPSYPGRRDTSSNGDERYIPRRASGNNISSSSSHPDNLTPLQPPHGQRDWKRPSPGADTHPSPHDIDSRHNKRFRSSSPSDSSSSSPRGGGGKGGRWVGQQPPLPYHLSQASPFQGKGKGDGKGGGYHSYRPYLGKGKGDGKGKGKGSFSHSFGSPPPYFRGNSAPHLDEYHHQPSDSSASPLPPPSSAHHRSHSVPHHSVSTTPVASLASTKLPWRSPPPTHATQVGVQLPVTSSSTNNTHPSTPSSTTITTDSTHDSSSSALPVEKSLFTTPLATPLSRQNSSGRWNSSAPPTPQTIDEEASLDATDTLLWAMRSKVVMHKLLDIKAKAAMGLHQLALDRSMRASNEASID